MPALVDFDTLPQMFMRVCAHYEGQQRPALAYKDRSTKEWTDIPWETLRERVFAMASYLHSRGVRKGDRVAILSENRPEWAITDLATQMLGAVNVALYTSLPASQVRYILQDSGTKAFVVSTSLQLRKADEIFDDCEDLGLVITMSEMRKERPDEFVAWDDAEREGAVYWAGHREEIDPLWEAVGADDVAALIYTSGTTGLPKGVMLTHENFCSNCKAALQVIPFFPEDHHMSFLPLSHSFERLAGYIVPLAAGAKVTYAESIDAVSKNMPEVCPTVMISVPRLFERIYNIIAKSVQEGSSIKQAIFRWAVATGAKAAQAGEPGPILRLEQSLAHKLVFAKLHEKLGGNLRFAVSGGAALPQKIGEFFYAAGITIVEGYGLTETSPVLSANPLDAPRYGTVGHVLPGVTVAIQRQGDRRILGQLTGEDYPSDLTTEAGEIIAKGPNIMKGYWNSEEATREAIDDEGWYHTGDVGRFEDGYLRITDRIKHMIVSQGGKNIYPGPIEDEFKTNPLIDQIMVVGEGQAYLTALVVPSEDAMRQHAKSEGLSFKGLDDLYAQEAVHKLFAGAFRDYSKAAAPHEKIRDFRLIREPFTVENGMMTPTLKLKRRVIEEQFAGLIDEMYADVV